MATRMVPDNQPRPAGLAGRETFPETERTMFQAALSKCRLARKQPDPATLRAGSVFLFRHRCRGRSIRFADRAPLPCLRRANVKSRSLFELRSTRANHNFVGTTGRHDRRRKICTAVTGALVKVQ